MSSVASQEGYIPFCPPSTELSCQTYYRAFGDLSCGSPVVVVLHGGPGAGHEYLLSFAELWPRYGLPLVFYDQIGCASSTHLPQTVGDHSFWEENLFVAELDNLLDHLQLRSGAGFHILGHSWGGRLAAAYAARQPPGLQKLVLASALASSELASRGRQLLVDQLPQDVRDIIQKSEETGDFANSAYKSALDTYHRTFFCRAEPFPPDELKPALKNLTDDKTVFDTMMGPSPVTIRGSLQGWTCIPRLHNITATTLLYNAEFDTSHDVATKPFFEHIPRVRWITITGGSHMCHFERPREKVLSIVGEFLAGD